MQAKVRTLFAQLGKDARVTGGTSRWVEIDAGKTRDDVAKACKAEVDKMLQRRTNEKADSVVGQLFMD